MMTNRLLLPALCGTALLALAGCSDATQRATYPPGAAPLTPSATGVQRAPAASLEPTAPAEPETVIAAPAPAVESGPLGDSPPSFNDQNPDGTLGVGGTEVAAVESAPSTQTAQPVSREAMIGAWTVAAGGQNCQIFLALTKWSGGYRAATRGCGGSDIAGVQAWDVQANRIVLVDASGGQAATLTKTGDTRYAGSTQGGGQHLVHALDASRAKGAFHWPPSDLDRRGPSAARAP